MKIMVAVKRVIDYAVKIRVKPDKVELSLSLSILELSKLFLCNNPKLR
jgi:electron transfer flavoprotein alpha/beta subunit